MAIGIPILYPQPGDVVVGQHWGQNGFANTDLDVQLKQRGIEKIIIIGMMANTCIEGTARSGAELGYHVTLVPDATTAFSRGAMRAAHRINATYFRARHFDNRRGNRRIDPGVTRLRAEAVQPVLRRPKSVASKRSASRPDTEWGVHGHGRREAPWCTRFRRRSSLPTSPVEDLGEVASSPQDFESNPHQNGLTLNA